MKKFLLAVAAVVLGSASVQAADLAAHYTKAPMMATAYNWTGFYVGGNVGGQWGSADPSHLDRVRSRRLFRGLQCYRDCGSRRPTCQQLQRHRRLYRRL